MVKTLIEIAETEPADHPRSPSGRFTNWSRSSGSRCC